jgi:glycosyltransferase involved in cell wall biosynthesis
MSTPVIIAARNEAEQIGYTLDSLSKQAAGAEPVVIVNGSTDNTPDIAREAGAIVLESEEGKMPAIQTGLRYLGKRALDPLLVLDADSHPFSKNWTRRMTNEMQSLPEEQSAIVWAPYIFNGEINPALGAFFSATSMQVSWVDRNKEHPRTIRGGNTGLFMKEYELLESMLSLPNYWPRQDVATFDTMMKHDSTHKVVFHPEAWILTSGYRINNTLKRIIKERRHPSKVTDGSYANEAPAGSQPYHSKTTETVKH